MIKVINDNTLRVNGPNIEVCGHQIALNADGVNPWFLQVGAVTFAINLKREKYFLRKYFERNMLPTPGNIRSLPHLKESDNKFPDPYDFIKAFLQAHQCVVEDKQTDCWSARWKIGESLTDSLKSFCYHIASAVWWIFFAILNYGILRSIGAEDGWKLAGQRCVTVSLLGMAICSIISLFHKNCRDSIRKYLTRWEYIRWGILYAGLWVGAYSCMYPSEHSIWWTPSFSEYIMEMVYILAYFGLFITTLIFMVFGAIASVIFLFSERKEEE